MSGSLQQTPTWITLPADVSSQHAMCYWCVMYDCFLLSVCFCSTQTTRRLVLQNLLLLLCPCSTLLPLCSGNTVKTDMQEIQKCLWSESNLSMLCAHNHTSVCISNMHVNVQDGVNVSLMQSEPNVWSLNRYLRKRRGRFLFTGCVPFYSHDNES